MFKSELICCRRVPIVPPASISMRSNPSLQACQIDIAVLHNIGCIPGVIGAESEDSK